MPGLVLFEPVFGRSTGETWTYGFDNLNHMIWAMDRTVDGESGGLLAKMDASGNIYWMIADHLGSIWQITNASGVVIGATTYDAYGNVASPSALIYSDEYGYAGYVFEATIGMDRTLWRFYDPTTGRWISQDPTGFAAGDTNLQRYVKNDPVNSTDPTGLAKKSTIIGSKYRAIISTPDKVLADRWGVIENATLGAAILIDKARIWLEFQSTNPKSDQFVIYNPAIYDESIAQVIGMCANPYSRFSPPFKVTIKQNPTEQFIYNHYHEYLGKLIFVTNKLKSSATKFEYKVPSIYQDFRMNGFSDPSGPAYVPFEEGEYSVHSEEAIYLTSQFWKENAEWESGRGAPGRIGVIVHEFGRLFLNIGPVSKEKDPDSVQNIYNWDAVVYYLSNQYDKFMAKGGLRTNH